MRRFMLVTVIASLLVGCGSDPAALTTSERQHTLGGAPKMPTGGAVQPLVRTIPGYKGPAPTVSVVASAPAAAAISQEAAAQMIAADSHMESVELLIQDGGAYFVQGWFADLKDAIKRTLVRWKLTKEVKQALKHNREQAFELHEGEIDNIRKNRSAPVTKINDLGGGNKEIVSTWASTNKGIFTVETRRVVDEEGVTQNLTVSTQGTDDKDLGIDLVRIRSLIGEEGTYKVATKQTTTYKDGRTEYQEWLKIVNVDGTEQIVGFITHPDGSRTDIKGTRDSNGKVKVEATKVAANTTAKAKATPKSA